MAQKRKTVFVYIDKEDERGDFVSVFCNRQKAEEFAKTQSDEEWVIDPKMSTHWTIGAHIHVYSRVVMYP